MSQVSGSVVPKSSSSEATATLVWIDSREAFVVRWLDGASKVEHVESDVPVHRRTTGGTRHDPCRTHGGGGIAPPPVEGRRLEHLARFVDQVAGRIPAEGNVLVLGPGTVREHLAREISEADEHAHRARSLTCRASRPLTVPQLVATLRDEIGEPPPRKPTTRRTRDPRRPPRESSTALLDELEYIEDMDEES